MLVRLLKHGSRRLTSRVLPRHVRRFAAAAAPVREQARPRLELDKSVEKVAPILFQLAHQANLVDEVEQNLKDWCQALEQSPAVQRLFVMPGVTHDRRAAKIMDAFERRIAARNGQDPKADQVDQIVSKALAALAKLGRLEHLDKLATGFTAVRKDFNKEVDCVLVTAVPLSKEKLDKIVAGVKNYIAPDEKLVVTTEVDEKVLGGFVARFGWNELDFSVASMVEAGAKKLATINVQNVLNPGSAAEEQTRRSPNTFRLPNGTTITIVNGKPVVKHPPGLVFKKREKGVRIPVPSLDSLKPGATA